MLNLPSFDKNYESDSKLKSLSNAITDLNNVVVLFSGGIDSSFLLYLCTKSLPKPNILNVIGVSQSLPERELIEARAFSKLVDVPLIELKTNELENELSIPNNFFIKNNLIFETIELISKGQLGQLFRQLQLIIDSDYDLYQEVSEFAGEDFSELIDSFEKSWLIKYPVYKYHDTDIGNIFICYDYDGKPLEIIDEEIINN